MECDVVTLEDGTQIAMLGSRSGEPIDGAIAVVVPARVARVLVTHLVRNAAYAVTAAAVDGAMQLEIARGSPFVATRTKARWRRVCCPAARWCSREGLAAGETGVELNRKLTLILANGIRANSGETPALRRLGEARTRLTAPVAFWKISGN